MTAKQPVRTPDMVRERLHALHTVEKLPYRAIAKFPDYEGIPAGTLCAIVKGYPIPKKYRGRFGLFGEAVVYVVTGGEVPPGAQVLFADVCACGQPFISNSPARKRCYICSPYKGKRRIK